MDIEEIGINAGNWVGSAQDRNYWRALVNAALNLRVPQAMELVSLVSKISLRSILLLSSHLHLGLPKWHFPIGLPVKI